LFALFKKGEIEEKLKITILNQWLYSRAQAQRKVLRDGYFRFLKK
jgi:hypothetical protein